MSKRVGCSKHPYRAIDYCVDCLKLELSDYVDTVKAMLFAARGGECDIETLRKEMDAVSTKPSEYIRYIVSEKDRQLADARAEIEQLALEIENKQYTITCASEENQQLKESLAEARTEIERLNKKLRLLLCEEHFEKCERGLFNSENPDDEPCLICLMNATERGGGL